MLCVEKYSVALPFKDCDVRLNGSSGERSQSLACSFGWLWWARMRWDNWPPSYNGFGFWCPAPPGTVKEDRAIVLSGALPGTVTVPLMILIRVLQSISKTFKPYLSSGAIVQPRFTEIKSFSGSTVLTVFIALFSTCRGNFVLVTYSQRILSQSSSTCH